MDEDNGKIEEMKESLYSRNAPDIRARNKLRFSKEEIEDIKTDWDKKEEVREDVVLNRQYKSSSMSFFTKLLIGSIIFFVVSIGIGAYIVFNGVNIISANNIDITVNGPATISGGDPLSFDIQVENKNNIKLQEVDLQVAFPSGTVDPEDRSKELKDWRELMDDISPGGVGQKTVKAVLYGEENSTKEITITVTYRVSGSNAIFKKEKTYDVIINSSPISVSVSSFNEVTSGQEFEMGLTVSSNSEDVISNVLLRASFPFGFTMTSSDVKQIGDSAVWRIGDIPSKGKKTIKIKGKLEGQNDESRVFRFSIGAASVRDSNTIGTEYMTATQEISIKKPFITAQIVLDEDIGDGKYIGRFGSPIRARISWFNNLPTAVIDGELHIKLSGNAFDKMSVSPEQGLYKSADNEIVWNKITTPELGNIEPGGSGNIYFSFTPRDFSVPSKLVTNPSINLELGVSGKRISESNVPENVVTSAKRQVIVSSNLSVSSASVRTTGPFQNTGPIPPKAEQQTTYTIVWTVDNTSSTITGAEVDSSLPAYVKWLGKVSPSSEDITYNSNNGQIVWKIGNVDSYTSFKPTKKQVIFQVGYTPSVADVGRVPVIVNRTTITGEDDFTGQNLSGESESVTTSFSTDPSFNNGDQIVLP